MADNAPSTEKDFPTTLSNAANQTIRIVLSWGEWAKGSKQQRKAIKLRKLFPKLIAPTGAPEEAAWGEEKGAEIQIPESLRDMGKQCLKHFSDAGKLGNDDVLEELFDAFGVHE